MLTRDKNNLLIFSGFIVDRNLPKYKREDSDSSKMQEGWGIDPQVNPRFSDGEILFPNADGDPRDQREPYPGEALFPYLWRKYYSYKRKKKFVKKKKKNEKQLFFL